MKLLDIINCRLDNPDILKRSELLQNMQDIEHLNKDDIAKHILLFVSALAPKAVASLLVSFILSRALWEQVSVAMDFMKLLGKHVDHARDIKNIFVRRQEFLDERGDISDEDLDCVLHEIYRCWAPFVGGRRVVTKVLVLFSSYFFVFTSCSHRLWMVA